MTSGDVEVEIPSLSQGVCPDCGGWVYGADALWHLEVLVRGVPLVVTS